MKKLGIGIVIILVICLILLVLAPFLVDLDRYKTPILAHVQPYINRDIDFQHIELTVFTGLGAEIQGLRVSDNPDFSKDDFLRLDSVQVKVEMLPLLKKEVRIKSVILKKPVISLARNAQGIFSFDDIIATLKKGAGKKASGNSGDRIPEAGAALCAAGSVAWAAEGEEKREAAPAAPIPILLDDLRIVNGKVTYRDEKALPGAGPLVVDMLNLRLKDVSVDKPMEIDASADLLESGGKNFQLGGSLGPLGAAMDVKEAPFDVNVSLMSLDLAKLPLKFPVKLLSGIAGADIAAKGSLGKSVASEAAIEIADLVFQERGKEEGKKSGNLKANLAAALSLDYPNQKLSIAAATLTLNENKLTLKGKIEDFLKEPRWEIAVDSDKLEPAGLMALFPQYTGAVPGELALEGPAQIRIASSGKMDQFTLDARVDTGAMKIAYGEIFRKPAGTALSLEVKGKKKETLLSFDAVDFVLSNLKAHASGNVRIEKDAPKYAFDLNAPPVSLEGWDGMVPLLKPYDLKGDLALTASAAGVPDNTSLTLQATSGQVRFSLPPAQETAKPEKPRTGMLKGMKLEVKGRTEKGLSSRGTLAVSAGEVMSIPFGAVTSDFASDPEQLKINSFSAAAFDGMIRGKGSYQIKTKEWAFSPSVENVNVETMLAALTEHKGIFSGSLSGSVQAKGGQQAGQEPLLQSQGDIALARGEWKNFNLVDSVLESLFGLKGVSQFLGGESTGAAQHASTKFDSLDGKFAMTGGLVQVKSLVLKNIQTSKATDSVAQLEGAVDVIKKTLDMKGAVILSKRHSEKLVQKADILKALLNKENMMVLPITLKGAISKPVPFLDVEYVMNALSNYYLKKGIDKGLEKLREKLGPAGSGGDTGKAVEGILKGLF